MGATKHTSGPWTIECGKNYSNEIVGKSKTGKDWVLARTTAAKVGRDQDDANARLIAAAPDLLEALKLAQSAVADFHSGMNTTRPSKETCERNERILGSIRAAIAKAEGRAE